LIFDVKGLIHPPDRVIAYLRYFEDSAGDRVRFGKRYAKVYSLSDRDRILGERYPHYIYYDHVFDERMEGVPRDYILKLYKPVEKASTLSSRDDLDIVEYQAVRLIQVIHDFTGVSLSYIGVSGSILVDLHSFESDIDIIVYGRRNCLSVYDGLKILLGEKRGGFSPYSLNDLKRLYDFRSRDTWMPFERFYEVKSRKVCQGRFLGRDFFVRFVVDWDEVGESYGDRLYRFIGYARVKARVEDDSDSIFTPCRYTVSNVEVLSGVKDVKPLIEVTSFRGRFCDQARKGESVIAEGRVEKVIEKSGYEYYRLVIGNRPSDFMAIGES
jgi:predicted nucleotidyltransferase